MGEKKEGSSHGNNIGELIRFDVCKSHNRKLQSRLPGRSFNRSMNIRLISPPPSHSPYISIPPPRAQSFSCASSNKFVRAFYLYSFSSQSINNKNFAYTIDPMPNCVLIHTTVPIHHT